MLNARAHTERLVSAKDRQTSAIKEAAKPGLIAKASLIVSILSLVVAALALYRAW